MRFIHIADVHLGAVPDSGCSWSAFREKEIWNTFKKVISLTKKEKIDLLLIAGDLFHRQPLVRELREVNYLFSTIPETEVVWCAGNHDYMKADSAYRKIEWEPNVHGFFSQQPEAIHLPGIDTWIYGFSYEQREIRENICRDIHPNGKPGVHILLAHGGDEKHVPFSVEDGAGFDYVALGHIHKPGVLLADHMAYAGALEPIDRNDMGPHGLMYGKIEKGNTKAGFVKMACREYQNLDVAIHSGTTQLALEQKVREAIEQKGTQNIYRIRIRGYRNPDMEFDKQPLYLCGYISEILDETRPCYDLELLRKQQEGTLVGEYIRCFDGKDGTVEQKALYYGLQALMEAEL
ncbi:MAG: DNA repair exonuclease [Clostridia bacterium]|nr:DNA repair exonuclease [Clostridia bacterium]NCC42227.1 DNA repair exonuclease [Clostridia bacterium]